MLQFRPRLDFQTERITTDYIIAQILNEVPGDAVAVGA